MVWKDKSKGMQAQCNIVVHVVIIYCMPLQFQVVSADK